MRLIKADTNYAFVYFTGFLLVSLLAFVTMRDSCSNEAYAQYAGSTCPTARK
jgi:hypothetical protein